MFSKSVAENVLGMAWSKQCLWLPLATNTGPSKLPILPVNLKSLNIVLEPHRNSGLTGMLRGTFYLRNMVILDHYSPPSIL